MRAEPLLQFVSALASLAAVVLCIEHFSAKLAAPGRRAAYFARAVRRRSWGTWRRMHPAGRLLITATVCTIALRAVVAARYSEVGWPPASPGQVAWSLAVPAVLANSGVGIWAVWTIGARDPLSCSRWVFVAGALLSAGIATFFSVDLPSDLPRALGQAFALSMGEGRVTAAGTWLGLAAVLACVALMPQWSPPAGPGQEGPVQLELPFTGSTRRSIPR